MFTNTATDHVVTVTTQPSEGETEQLELQNAMSEGKLVIAIYTCDYVYDCEIGCLWATDTREK